MCGIAGYFSTSHAFSSDDLKQMTESILHRGPDAGGYFEDNWVGLGNRRLSIIDLSVLANQPIHSQSGRYVISYNGEVYNFREIARELTRLNPALQLHTSGDTEVVLEAFAQWGPQCVNRFNGMFAFAIYDKQENQLYLFRDRVGIKPLYYFYDGKNFAFASELKALTHAQQIRSSLSINKNIISTFLYLGYVPEPHCIFHNIFKMPSGSVLTINKYGLNISSYWKPEEKIDQEVYRFFYTAKRRFKELLTDAVNYCLISDVPYGIFLSGGTDSSLVAAVAQKLTPQKVTTFTIGFKEAKFNEAPHARNVAKYLNTEHHEFTASYADALQLFDEIISTYDEPFADSSSVPTMLVSKLARNHVKMVLSGDGGDELFWGYGAYKWASRLSNPFISLFRHQISYSLSKFSNREKRAAHLFEYPDKETIKGHIFSQEQGYFSENEIHMLMTPDFSHEIFHEENFTSLRRNLNPKEDQSLYDLKFYLKDDLLAKVDRASMKYGLEVRVPILDYRIVEFAINLHSKLKMHGNVQKYMLKETLADYLPRNLFVRPKWGFSLPMQLWLNNELKYLVDDYLNESTINHYGIVQYPFVRELKKRFFAGEEYLYQRLWALIILHKFLSEFDKRKNPAQQKPAMEVPA